MNRFTLIFIFCTIFTFAHSTLGNGQTVKCNPASGTLPIIYITTSSGQEITSKDNYIGARYYIDASGCKDFVSVGSADAQLGTQIKGRGNHTWYNFDKKPYKLKLSERRGLLGMKSNRHFVLLAHADDKNAFLRNTIGFEVSRLFGMEYTPSQVPVELYINGNYRGLYFLTENIRIDSDRVDIEEQYEGDTNPNNVTGGWLLEIDNYKEDESVQFRMIEKGDDWINVTSHSPEVMSDVQYTMIIRYGVIHG